MKPWCSAVAPREQHRWLAAILMSSHAIRASRIASHFSQTSCAARGSGARCHRQGICRLERHRVESSGSSLRDADSWRLNPHCNRLARGRRIVRVQRTLSKISVCTALTALCALICATAAAAESITRSKVRLKTPGYDIAAEIFEPAGFGKRPVVLVLHGAGGRLLDGPEMRRMARALAAEGNAVYVLRYFGRTGTIVALDSTMQRHFGDWLETVRSSIVAVQDARGDASPVGIYGYSLGAFVALRAASDNPRVGAVVVHAGGVFNETYDRIGRLPPVLMIHGERDARVPFARYAQPLIPVLRRRARALETRFFRDEGHGFTQASMASVRAEAAKFFRRHLRRSPGERARPGTRLTAYRQRVSRTADCRGGDPRLALVEGTRASARPHSFASSAARESSVRDRDLRG